MRNNTIATMLCLAAMAAGIVTRETTHSSVATAAVGGAEREGQHAPAAFDPLDLGELPEDPAGKSVQVTPAADPAERSWTDPVTGLAVTKPTIIQLSLPGCGPCIAFMAGGKDPYERVGWDVCEIKGPFDGVERYPSYRILNRGEWYWHRGPMTPASLKRALGISQVTQQAYSEPVTFAAYQPITQQYVSAIPSSSCRSWTQGGRAWSEASLRSHLYAENHRYPPGSLDHLSLGELDRLHTADHEGQRHAATIPASDVGILAMSGGCPPGGCPPRSMVVQSQRGAGAIRWRRW